MVAFSSLKFRIAATIFILEGVMMGLTFWQVFGELQRSTEQQIVRQERVILDLLKGQSLQALVTEEFSELQPLFESLQRDQRIVRAVLADDKERVVAASNAGDLGGRLTELKPGEEAYWRSQEVGRGSGKLGTLALEFSRAPLDAASSGARNLGLLIAAVGMIFIAIVGVITGWLLTRRLDRLRSAAQRIAAGDLTVRSELQGTDEVAALSASFDQMAARIAADQEVLHQANAELEQRVHERTAELVQSVEELRRTQEHLVHSEKLAALGSLVAGVAHEVNTPVGNSVTAATYLDEKVKELAALYQSGSISRQDLTSFIAAAAESNAMILSNLQRAAELIRSFKMVAVDQTSSKRREFYLKDSVEEVMTTLRHLLKGGAVRIELDLADGIRMDSYPGPLGQVITNLFNNAMVHAFDGRAGGCIRIEARPQGDNEVVLRFMDDGIGIPAVNMGKIFDPFFTTKFGQGGSGLGLNIVYNIVSGMLGGSISVESLPGQGTTFTLTLPRVSPFVEKEVSA